MLQRLKLCGWGGRGSGAASFARADGSCFSQMPSLLQALAQNVKIFKCYVYFVMDCGVKRALTKVKDSKLSDLAHDPK